VGTLCVAVHEIRQFTREEMELLMLIGTELGVAVEKAKLYEESERFQENLHTYVDQITRAHEEERKRIARELHDDSIQALAALSQRMDALTPGEARSTEAETKMERMRRELDGVQSRIRRFIQDLRPPTLDYLGLIPALRELVSQLKQQAGVDSELHVNGDERNFSPEDELLIYRVVQEALTNVGKHSKAHKAEVTIDFHDDRTTVAISDDGEGFDVGPDSGFVQLGKIGLAGMEERAHLLDSQLTINSKPGQGTQVVLDISRDHWNDLPL
jgi:signal transduction histidine kinase